MKLDRNRIFSFMLAAAFALVLAGCGGGGGTTQTPNGGTPAMPDPAIAERKAIKDAIDAASNAVAMVKNDSSDAVVSMADKAVMDARSAIAAADNVPAAEKAANTGTVDEIASRLSAAKMARKAAMDADMMAKDKAMMATAMKLHMGISKPGGSGDDTRTAVYGTDGTVDVTVGSASAVMLKEDKKAMVADNHGWMGKKYTHKVASGDNKGDTYEAVVYSNVGEPTQGKKFGSNDGAGDEFQYGLTNGELAIDTSDAAVAGRVASSRFDQSAGTKMFKLPANTVRVMIPGSYHGVSGTYNCTPASDQTCSATIAAKGFTLTGGTWTFKATNPETRLMDVPDPIYASYGWWIKKTADGAFTASAFAGDMGEVPAASGVTALRGTATYMGGAAGKYALYSSTGGTNDAGHFTARATLEADFNDDMVTGTIDNFMGADGKARNWSVELKKSGISDAGAIAASDGEAAEDDPLKMTVWTIDGTAAAAAGEWSGMLKDNDSGGVPKVGTGTFYSMYSTSGKMVGAFGVNRK